MQEIVLKTLFWSCAGLLAFIYALYPLFLFFLARWFPRHLRLESQRLPRISLIISAFNEEAVITEKISNCLNLDYPAEYLEVLVVSDCSYDRTDEIVRSFSSSGVRLIRQAQRFGKSAGLNLAVPAATGEIVVFSDANALYESNALRHMVKHFADPNLGYVVGNARYTERANLTASAESEGLYWKLETWLKQKESEFGSVVGGDGAIYAIRRELYTPLRSTDINDFLNPLQIIVKGYRGVYEPSAICFEEAGDTFAKEFRRKVRIVSRSLNAVFRAPAVLLPWVQPRHWLALISHKILRWFSPFFLLIACFANLLLWSSPFYRAIACFQLGFYFLALIGWAVESRYSVPRLLLLPYYFCLVNLASFVGILKCISGSLAPTWQTIREDMPARPGETVEFVKKEP
jgi:cellulose synthase/poly-beta-1,6-N-acetylglucosamine synthase-like glycosyltransferase